ncbi:MAG: helix-turn-helix transcriptional regulator [Rhodospirillales bacterium]|jgi:AraC-like DNA-binding protein
MSDQKFSLEACPNLKGDLAFRPGLGAAGVIVARRNQELRTVPAFEPAVILVLEGTKEVGRSDGIVALPAGSYLTMRAGCEVDLGNLPSPVSGCYRALVLSFAKETLQAFAQQYPARIARDASGPAWRGLPPNQALKDGLFHAYQGFQGGQLCDDALRCRLIEVLILLADHGCRWPAPGLETDAERVRLLLSSRPAAPWSAADAAGALGISESSLRRRLSQEGTGFRAILSDIRLSTGLMLLQTSEASIADIALACGYESPSRFAERFQARFGTLPSRLRLE